MSKQIGEYPISNIHSISQRKFVFHKFNEIDTIFFCIFFISTFYDTLNNYVVKIKYFCLDLAKSKKIKHISSVV